MERALHLLYRLSVPKMEIDDRGMTIYIRMYIFIPTTGGLEVHSFCLNVCNAPLEVSDITTKCIYS